LEKRDRKTVDGRAKIEKRINDLLVFLFTAVSAAFIDTHL
jgi:hypothetical protein